MELYNDEEYTLGFRIMWNNRISATPCQDFPEFYLQFKKKNVFDRTLNFIFNIRWRYLFVIFTRFSMTYEDQGHDTLQVRVFYKSSTSILIFYFHDLLSWHIKKQSST